MTDEKRKQKILSILKREYPRAKIALNYETPWQLVVAVVLSAQTTDIQVNKVTKRLFKKYKKLKDYAEVPLWKLQEDISSVGFYKNKAKYIKKSAKILLDKFDGEIPENISDLTKLPGVARKTANVIIGNLYGPKAMEGIAVDTHVARISQRLRFVDLDKLGKGRDKFFKKDGKRYLDYKAGINADKVEKQLMEVIPRKNWFEFTYWIIDHGRKICKAQSPKCQECPLKALCPSSRV